MKERGEGGQTYWTVMTLTPLLSWHCLKITSIACLTAPRPVARDWISRLYHNVLRWTRLGGAREVEKSGEGIYVSPPHACGLMPPYVCVEKWQAKVVSESGPILFFRRHTSVNPSTVPVGSTTNTTHPHPLPPPLTTMCWAVKGFLYRVTHTHPGQGWKHFTFPFCFIFSLSLSLSLSFFLSFFLSHPLSLFQAKAFHLYQYHV